MVHATLIFRRGFQVPMWLIHATPFLTGARLA